MDNSSCIGRVIAKYNSQTATVAERKIASFIKENMDKAVHCTLLELAELIGVSDATVVRFCKSLGYKGFQEFKICAAMETIPSSQQYHPKLQKDDDPEEICKKIFSTEITALQRTLQALDMETVAQVGHILSQASRIVFAGTGASMLVCQDAHHKFLQIGIHVSAAEDKDIQLMEAALLRPGDVLFAVSHSGFREKPLESVIRTGAGKGKELFRQANHQSEKAGQELPQHKLCEGTEALESAAALLQPCRVEISGQDDPHAI